MVCKANESLAGWCETIDAMNFMRPNLDSVIDFTEGNMTENLLQTED